MADESFISQIDALIGEFFASWNYASTAIVGLLVIVLVYPLFISKEPDIHPFLLARQAAASPIRYPGESATYRSTEIPYGYPLRSGLAIKDPGASKWVTGRDGDLRDVWRQAVNGTTKENGSKLVSTTKISTVLGTEKVIQHDLKEVTKDINAVGNFVKKAGGSKVAVCLSNSIELLETIFASAFYLFPVILIPLSQDSGETTKLLSTTDFDTLIVEAGSISLESLLSSNKSLRRIIWVARGGGKGTDWSQDPPEVNSKTGKLDITVWHDLVTKDTSASNEVLPVDKDATPASVFTLWPTKSGKHELVEYTHANLVSAVAALSSSFPRLHKLTPTDSILPTIPLTTTYGLTWALLSLFSGSTLLLTTIAGPKISLLAATKSARQLLKPTHIVADARALPKFVGDIEAAYADGGFLAKYASWSLNRSLVQGNMPVHTAKPGYLPSSLSNLKALYIDLPSYIPASERPTSSTLATLRLLLSARISLALTSGSVAGYVAQSNSLDYRDKKGVVSVGAVASSIELHLTGDETEMEQNAGVGELVAKGPAVVGGKGVKKVVEGVKARFDADNTVVLVE